RASVIRGQIFYKQNLPLSGVKIQISNIPSLGYTISNKEGFFNLLVNGGGSILLDFTRQPFKSKQLSIFIPWNKFVHIGYIYMNENDINENKINEHINSTCLSIHDNFIEPKIWKTSLYRTLIDDNNDYSYTLGSQILRKYIPIPDTDINLVYTSTSSTKKYYSVINIVLTSNSIHSDLMTIHLQISIEVSVGYEYYGCTQIVWRYQTTIVNGQDMPAANVGGWNFNVHHRLNLQEDVLHKGDGTNILMSELPWIVTSIAGIQDQIRSIECKKCIGQAATIKLLNPTNVAISNDGTIFIGDLNIIWIIQTTGIAMPVLELSYDYAYKYYMTTDPIDGRLYIADYQRRQIIRLITTLNIKDLTQNYEVVVGDGNYCGNILDNDGESCGDNLTAQYVSLSYPKGLTINKEGTLYFIDGNRIRQLRLDNSRVTNIV
ncbi:unnamed protein product, partial [Didymodactylos carnosus]